MVVNEWSGSVFFQHVWFYLNDGFQVNFLTIDYWLRRGYVSTEELLSDCDWELIAVSVKCACPVIEYSDDLVGFFVVENSHGLFSSAWTIGSGMFGSQFMFLQKTGTLSGASGMK